MRTSTSTLFGVMLLAAAVATAVSGTETENLGIRVLKAPGKMTIDGKVDDWDLSAPVLACGDVENARESFAVWIHAGYDRENLYLLARWRDQTPMNNPGSIKGDYGFRGDCLQVRFIVGYETPQERVSHWTCWRDRDGLQQMNVSYGRKFNEGGLADARTAGAQQAFAADADGKGYVQEMAIPWKLIARDGAGFAAGDRIRMTVEPNFTIGGGGRLTIKDIFMAGEGVDRVFTFNAYRCWGEAVLTDRSGAAPPPVRLRDGREFAVRMEGGLPSVDWTGLVVSKEPKGFIPIEFSMPEDGYVSLNLYGDGGSVVRQLRTCNFYTKGRHTVFWDGLTTHSLDTPGAVVEPGAYTWRAIWHKGIGLRLVGWADNAGDPPWEGPTGRENWGADHGNPCAAASDGRWIYLGWHSGEAGKPLVAVDQQGRVQWRNIRGGIAGARLVAVDRGTVYAYNDIGQYAAKALYRVDARTGGYTEWSSLKSTDLLVKDLWPADAPEKPDYPNGLSAKDGRVFISVKGFVLVVDGAEGRLIRAVPFESPGDIEALSASEVLVVSKGLSVVRLDVDSGKAARVAGIEEDGRTWIAGLAVDRDGAVYLGLRGRNQVEVFDRDGRHLRTIGRPGGRPLTGPWDPTGMLSIAGMTVDGAGKLWVAEDDGTPRRISVWDAKTGAFEREYFGASSYGATGSAINPVDPHLLVGQGCEWRIDPRTGKAACLGVITRQTGMANSRFGFGPGGRLYLAVSSEGIHPPAPVYIFERLGEGAWKLRAKLWTVDRKQGYGAWADANDDGLEQPDEVKTWPDLQLGGWISGWYMPMTPDLTFYGTLHQLKVAGWTTCGAPLYDFSKAARLPGPADAAKRGGMGAYHGHGSADGRFMLWNGGYGMDHSTVDCYDIASGKLMWIYPSNFTGVHGSHRAGPPEPGLMRGAYDITGSATLPEPIGNIWVVPTNKGEWHILTEQGFYLAPLFQGDMMKVQWPDAAVPGALFDNCPPGAGEEAFGGSVTLARDGRLYVAAGHTAFYDLVVTGLDTVRELGSGRVSLDDAAVRRAAVLRGELLQSAAGKKQYRVARASPRFTGDLKKDFAGAQIVQFSKGEGARASAAAAFDDTTLYLAWDVQDRTPWVNGADAPEFLYARGDTVDFQFGADPKAPPGRREAERGDLRLSIGPFQGKPLAVLYRRVAADRANARHFRSGVFADYEMQSVTVLDGAKIVVQKRRDGYVVEVAVPLAALDFKPAAGEVYRGDFGVTFGTVAGNDTGLRSYWSNQATGIVSDEVVELQMAPANWAEMRFGETGK